MLVSRLLVLHLCCGRPQVAASAVPCSSAVSTESAVESTAASNVSCAARRSLLVNGPADTSNCIVARYLISRRHRKHPLAGIGQHWHAVETNAVAVTQFHRSTVARLASSAASPIV